MRRSFKALGLDPARWRPSAEALCRRLVLGRGLSRINDVVDAGNVVSAETCLCIGLYDAARIRGGIVCRIGRDAETYQDVTGRETNAARKIVLADEAGVFGAPTDDSYRTRITQDTRSLLFVFFAPNEAFSELAETACEELSSLLRTSCNYGSQGTGRTPELV
jgi:DNA/RNA-binding domain of Phe-tRNA-synthetase-like protein